MDAARAIYLTATAAQLAAFGMAVTVARGRRDFMPIAVYLGVEGAASWARAALSALVLVPARAGLAKGAPFTEPAHVAAVAVDGALWLLGPAGTAAVALAVFTARPRRWAVLVAVGWLTAAAALAAGYPVTRGATLARFYLAAELAGLAVSLGAFVPWAWLRKPPTLPHVAVLFVLGIWVAEIASAAGPWRAGNPFARWYVPASMQVVLFALLFLLEAWSCWKPSSRCSRS